MGLVPLGTGNLLARNLGIDITDPVAASYDVLSGTDTKVDVVKATLDHAETESSLPGDGRTWLRRRDHGQHRRRTQGPRGLARVR